MSDIQVRFIIGPAYFGEPRLVRDVFEIIAQAAMGHTAKIVTDLHQSEDPAVGLRAEIAATAHPDASKQIAAAIRQSMMLPATVPVEILFDETDVMRNDNVDDLLGAVTSAQKSLKVMTDDMFDRFLYW